MHVKLLNILRALLLSYKIVQRRLNIKGKLQRKRTQNDVYYRVNKSNLSFGGYNHQSISD